MTPEEREELLASYALGTLNGPDAAEVEALVRSDASVAEQLVSYHDFVDLIALSVPLKRADPSLRRRVLQAARRETQSQLERGRDHALGAPPSPQRRCSPSSRSGQRACRPP